MVFFTLNTSGQTFRGLSDVPLPGGPDLGSDPMHVTVVTKDVLSLARQASVKVDDVTVGRVDSIERVGWHAEVELSIRNDVRLPANAIAVVRQTGLLGEKFVELAEPFDEPSTGRLADDATISLDRSSRSFEVEEVLGALSMLLNDGGLERLHTITSELHTAIDGREADFRDVLRRLNRLTGTFDRNRDSIVAAIDGLDSFSTAAANGTRTIERALDTMGPALAVLADQRQELARLLEATSRLGVAGTRTIGAVRDDLVANLQFLAPILERLAGVGKDLPEAVPYLLSYPFPDNGMTAFKGDYVNLDVVVNLDLAALLSPSEVSETEVPDVPLPGLTPGPAPVDPDPLLPGLPGLSDSPNMDPLRDLLSLNPLLQRPTTVPRQGETVDEPRQRSPR